MKKKKYNVLWLMSDQHNPNCTGYEGNLDVKTPNLDKIAKNGLNYTNAMANNPICSPSRICFMTGQYMKNHRMFSNNHTGYQHSNPNTLACLFRRYGYQTGLFGKSHMIRKWDEEGFEVIRYTDLCDAKHNDPETCHYFKMLADLGIADYYEEGVFKSGQEYMRTGSKPSLLPYEYSIEKFTGDETLKFLENRDESRPFFIHMSFQRPHDPIAPAKEFFDMYDPDKITLPDSKVDWFENNFSSKAEPIRSKLANYKIYPLATDEKTLRRCVASYYGLITAIDSEIGRVIKALEESGELENTIIFYTADHGDFAGEHGLFYKNLGIYESIQRVPFLLSYPNCEQGKTVEKLVESVDFYKTICDLCSIPVPAGVNGVNILDEQVDKDAAYCEWEWGVAGERISAIRTKDARLVYWGMAQTGELYDRRKDPDELYNLWNDPSYNTLKISLLEKLLAFTMQGKVTTGLGLATDFAEPNSNCVTEKVQKGQLYYSTLQNLYNSKDTWPPKK